MTAVSAIPVFVVVWWIVLFAVLPWGVRSPHDEGRRAESFEDPGAPVRPLLGVKFAVTTGIALVVTGLFWMASRFGWLPDY